MFKDTTLVVVGDSFIFGHYGDDVFYKTCWKRSWVSKLSVMADFKDYVNLGLPGGSNQRSYRVIMNYITNNYFENKKFFVIFAATDLLRFEVPFRTEAEGADKIQLHMNNHCPFEPLEKHKMLAAGTWTKSETERIQNYIDTHNMYFNVDEYSRSVLNHNILNLHVLFRNLNIPHCFTQTVGPVDTIYDRIMEFSIPKIKYPDPLNSMNNDLDYCGYLINNGFKPGPCTHFDHDGNEFMANYIYSRIKGGQNGL